MINIAVEFFEWLNKTHNVAFPMFYDAYSWNQFATGLRYTALLAISSILGSVAVGLSGAYLQLSRRRLPRAFIAIYIQAFRNTPPLIQLYFFYFALGPYLTRLLALNHPVLSNVIWAIASLTLYAGAFNVEIFRAGIEAVPRTTLEAADALGLNKRQIFCRITLPLAFRISLPALNNNLVNLIKTTTLAFAIGVPELLYASSQIWSENLNTLEMMLTLLAFYCSVTGIFILMMNKWERTIAIPGWGRGS